jgi:hypothetical protein
MLFTRAIHNFLRVCGDEDTKGIFYISVENHILCNKFWFHLLKSAQKSFALNGKYV